MPIKWILLIKKYWKQLLLVGILPFLFLIIVIIYPFYLVSDAQDKVRGWIAKLIYPFTTEAKYYEAFEDSAELLNEDLKDIPLQCPEEYEHALVVATLQYPMYLDQHIYDDNQTEATEEEEEITCDPEETGEDYAKCLEEEEKDRLKNYHKFAIDSIPNFTFGEYNGARCNAGGGGCTNIKALSVNMVREEEHIVYDDEGNVEDIYYDWHLDYDKYKKYLKEQYIPDKYKYFGFESREEAASDTEELDYIIEQIFQIKEMIIPTMKEEFPGKCGEVDDGIFSGSSLCEGRETPSFLLTDTIPPYPKELWNYIRVTSNYGNRWHPVDGIFKMHDGTDFVNDSAKTITAVAGGVVTKVVNVSQQGRCKSGSDRGTYIDIESTASDGTVYIHRYQHLVYNSVKYSIGDTVRQGDNIGTEGNTGCSTGSHLHFEILVGGQTQDPIGVMCGMKSNITNTSNVMVAVDGKTYTLEYYIGGVIAAELGTTDTPIETLKALAIASRTYALSRGYKIQKIDTSGNPYIEIQVQNSQSFQTFDIEKFNSYGRDWRDKMVEEVINATEGMVLTRDGKLFTSEYSACNETIKTQPDQEEKDSYCSQVNYDKAKEISGEDGGIYVVGFDDRSKNSGHGRGMSLKGAVYGTLINSWTYIDVLKYYYDVEDNDIKKYDPSMHNGDVEMQPMVFNNNQKICYQNYK